MFFFLDEELRKVVSSLQGGIICTAQERLIGTRQSPCLGLLQRFLTGEPLAGRLPYDIYITACISRVHVVAAENPGRTYRGCALVDAP